MNAHSINGRRAAVLLVLSSLGSGCAPLGVTSRATIPHPSRTEVIAPATQLATPAPREERALGVSHGALVDRAALASVAPERICVQLALWAPPHQPTRNRVEDYELRLVADGAEGSSERRAPEVRSVGEWVEQRNRRSRIGWMGYVQTQQVPIAYRASDLCFSNDALLSLATRELRLELRRGGRTQSFAWRLDPDLSYPPEAAGADGSAISPAASDVPLAPNRGGYAQAYGYRGAPTGQGGSLTAMPYPTQQVPGGHPVDVAQLEALLDAQMGNLRLCISRAAEQDPRLNTMQGRMVAELTIGPSGPRNVRVVENDFTPASGACLQRHLEQLPIPPDPMRWTALFRYGVMTRQTTQGTFR